MGLMEICTLDHTPLMAPTAMYVCIACVVKIAQPPKKQIEKKLTFWYRWLVPISFVHHLDSGFWILSLFQIFNWKKSRNTTCYVQD